MAEAFPDKPPLILIVDDDDAARMVLKYSVPEPNRLAFACNGSEALEQVAAELPDLILLDRNMPVVDGDAVLKQLRGDPETAHLSVIMVTADAREAAELSGLDLGANDYVTKPVNINLLQARIRIQLEQVRLTRELASKERLARQIFDAAPTAMLVIGEEGTILQANPQAEQLFDFDTDELLGKPVEVLVPEELRQAHRGHRGVYLEQPGYRMMGGREPLRGLKKDGSRIPISVSLSPFASDQGPVTIVNMTDLSERYEYERQLSESSQRYRQLFMDMAQGAVYHDSKGRVVDANPAACRILGMSLDQLSGRTSLDPHWQAIHEDGSPFPGETHPAMVALERGEPVNDVVMGLYHGEGVATRWILVNAHPIFDQATRKPERVFVTFTDISKRVRAERSFQQEQRFNEAVVEGTGGVFIVIDCQGIIVKVNQAVESITGFSRAELIGASILQKLIPPEEVESVGKIFDDLCTLSGASQFENEWLTARGERVPFHWYNSVITDEQGKVTHVVAQGHDLTQLKAKQQVIEQDREHQRLLRELLEEGFATTELIPSLEHCLKRLVNISWLSLEAKGAVFLVDEQAQETLRLQVQYNLSSPLLSLCEQVAFGHCLCGRAAASRQLVYAHCVDDRHQNRFPGMQDHGHYSLPLMLGEQLLGVMVLYLPLGFLRDTTKEDFLLAVANVMAIMIQRKRDERALQEREELYRSVVDTASDGFAVIDEQGMLIEVNEAYRRYSGYSREELLQMRASDLDVGDSVEDVKERIDWIVEQNSVLFQTRHRRKDGSTWPVEVSINVAPKGSKGRFFAFVRDITEREALQQQQLRHQVELEEKVAQRTAELEQNRKELSTIFEGLPAIVYIKGLDGRYQMINRRYEEETGLTRQQVIGKVDLELFEPGQAHNLMALDQQVITRGEAITEEEVLTGKDGLLHNFLSTKVPLLDASHTPYALLGISIDVTRLKQLQIQLSRAEALAHLGGWGYDIAAETFTGSEEACRIFGVKAVAGMSWSDMYARFHEEDVEEAEEAWSLALSQAVPMDMEKRIRVNGEVRWVRFQAEVLLDDEGKAVRLEGSVQDITDVKDFHEALLSALTESEHLARIRSEFLANMSHEIRTPLNGILGLAQVGQRECRGSKTQRLFDQLLQSGNLLLGIVNDILDFSKIEAGKLQINPVPMPLSQVLSHVSLMWGDRASVKGYLLKIEQDDEVPAWILGDPLRISQILVNLVGNAVKFTEAGEVVLSLRVRDGRLLFEVRDSGIGMSAEQMEGLFQPFEQADGSITRRFGGTGLGLAISKSLVDLMRGTIEVESELGVGSCFRVFLPLQVVDAQEIPSENDTVGAGERRLHGLRILSAEDNAVNRMVLEDMLALEGAQVTSVEDGQQALDLLLREGDAGWDILLSDIHMPNMSGYELAQILSQQVPDLPIIGVTAHAMIEERERCLQAGMVEHVAKPIILDTLVTAISHHARRRAEAVDSLGQEAVADAPASEAEAPAAGAWPLQAFIDEEQVLAQYNGRRSFVEKLLDTLLESHGDAPDSLLHELDIDDMGQLAFIAHSFAGVAGAVRADALRAQAKAVEGLARNGGQGIDQAVKQLARDIERMLQAIRQYRPEPPE